VGHRRPGLEGGDARAERGERARGDVVARVVLHGDPLPRPGPGSTPRRGRSPLLVIVFIPPFVGGIAFLALLFAATAGSRDACEQCPQEGTTAAEEGLSRVAPSGPSSARAA
jgi:hypothetical protein